MRAAQISQYGDSSVITINPDAPVPAVGDEQVLVEVYAASINPFDSTLRQGSAQGYMPLKFPAVIGGDFAGIVSQVGKNVKDFAKGDEVYGQAKFSQGKGSFAEMAVADAKVLARKPQSIDFIQAAALPLTGVSTLQVLVGHMKLQSGQKILIHGGAGGIGTMSIQLAKHIGAYVATTVNSGQINHVKQLGANEIIDYEKRQFEDVLTDYDAVFDTVGGETYRRSFKVLNPGGLIVSMTEQPANDLMKQYDVRALAQNSQVNTEDLTKLARLVDAGAIKPFVDKTFSLDEVATAMDYQQTGHAAGKVVVKIK